MDGSQFDKLTRLVGSRLSRRAGLGLLAAAGLLARADTETTAKRGKASRRKGKGKGKGKGKHKNKKIAICHQGQTLTVSQRGWQGAYPGATQGACCATCPDMCFGIDNIDNNGPTGFDCCPADKFCAAANGLPDQCCDVDEVCARDNNIPAFLAQGSLCCRSCSDPLAQSPGCCGPGFVCDATNTCQSLSTARFPRYRRP